MELGQKEKKQIAIIAGLSVVMILAWLNAFKSVKRPKPKPAVKAEMAVSAANPAAEVVAPAVILSGRDIYRELSEVSKNIKLQRDPFALSFSRGGLRLMGILWDQTHPRAIINNIVVEPGQTIEATKIVQISKDKVVLSDGQDTFELKME